MYDRVLVISINSYYSKVPSTGIEYRYRVPVPRYYFSKVPSTDTAVLLRRTLPTTEYNTCPQKMTKNYFNKYHVHQDVNVITDIEH